MSIACAQILDICCGPDAKSAVFLTRKQFYAVLKLVAAQQAGLEVHKEAVTASLDDTALPRFTWAAATSSGGGGGINKEQQQQQQDQDKRDRENNPPPGSTTESESDDVDDSPGREPGGGGGGGCSTDSPTPTNSVAQQQDRKEGDLDNSIILVDSVVSGGWQGLLVSEEQRQLLGTTHLLLQTMFRITLVIINLALWQEPRRKARSATRATRATAAAAATQLAAAPISPPRRCG